jgi:two-component system, OmpR family, phosphate regulon sensor histidine kinase PhoR
MSETKTYDELVAELEELRMQVLEANEMLHAIKTGQIDALFIENEKGHQLYSLKTADHTYRVFIEKMKEGAVTLNARELILYSNSQFATMVGLPLSKVISSPFREFVPEESMLQFDQLIRRGWQSDSKGELYLRNGNGELIPFLLSFTSLELDEGTSLSIILTDLSMQKEVEKELKQKNDQLEEVRHKIWAMNEELEDIVQERTKDLLISREHFKSLADNIPVMVWTTKPDGSVDYFNKRWYQYTGMDYAHSRGSGFLSVLHKDDYESTLNAWNHAIKNRTDFELQFRLLCAENQAYRWFLAKGHPLLDEKGVLIGWFGTYTDIEDQKQEMEKKDEFISVASHELKTPLTSLKGYIQLMEFQQDLPANVSQYIKKANDSINKLQHLINDLLDVSKIHAGKLKFDMEEVNLEELLTSCVENCVYMYPTYKITKDINPGIIVRGNAERLEQVLMNLVSNAVKYSPDHKEIIIRSLRHNGSVAVSVTDFGIGLTEADQTKIFERFYRAERSSLFTSGLGMGLYISSEIIKEHNGQISVDSRIHEGTTISFTLPVAR